MNRAEGADLTTNMPFAGDRVHDAWAKCYPLGARTWSPES